MTVTVCFCNLRFPPIVRHYSSPNQPSGFLLFHLPGKHKQFPQTIYQVISINAFSVIFSRWILDLGSIGRWIFQHDQLLLLQVFIYINNFYTAHTRQYYIVIGSGYTMIHKELETLSRVVIFVTLLGAQNQKYGPANKRVAFGFYFV